MTSNKIQKLRLKAVRLLGQPVEIFNKTFKEHDSGIVRNVELGGECDWMIVSRNGALGGVHQFTLEIVSAIIRREGRPTLIELN